MKNPSQARFDVPLVCLVDLECYYGGLILTGVFDALRAKVEDSLGRNDLREADFTTAHFKSFTAVFALVSRKWIGE